jgi:hypothetical protein
MSYSWVYIYSIILIYLILSYFYRTSKIVNLNKLILRVIIFFNKQNFSNIYGFNIMITLCM